MFLRELTIANYKNIEDARLSFTRSINCFIGQNGMGKTNVLDAVYYLSFCRSSLHYQDMYNVRHGADFMMLQGKYRDALGGELEVTCSFKPGGSKKVFADGKKYARYSSHIGRVPLVMVSPTDSLLVSGGSEERRKFMNQIIAQYDAAYLESLIRYERALKQRNAILKTGTLQPDVMDILEEMMSQESETLYARRREFVDEFLPVFQGVYAELCGHRAEPTDIRFDTFVERGTLSSICRANREREAIVGYTLSGSHRDDLDFLLGGYPVRHEGSQGQTKTYFLALKLAQFVYLGQKAGAQLPILLLDDIFDKLDAHRVEQIIGFVSQGTWGQIFITDTNRDHIDRLLTATQRDHEIFYVEEGKIQSKDGTPAL